jgi:hypothetical protein
MGSEERRRETESGLAWGEPPRAEASLATATLPCAMGKPSAMAGTHREEGDKRIEKQERCISTKMTVFALRRGFPSHGHPPLCHGQAVGHSRDTQEERKETGLLRSKSGASRRR